VKQRPLLRIGTRLDNEPSQIPVYAGQSPLTPHTAHLPNHARIGACSSPKRMRTATSACRPKLNPIQKLERYCVSGAPTEDSFAHFGP